MALDTFRATLCICEAEEGNYWNRKETLWHILSMRTVKRTSTIDSCVFLVFLFDLL